MANPIYKMWKSKPTEAWYQLSQEARDRHLAQIEEALEHAGGKRVVTCTPIWAAEQWLAFGIEEFPDIEAVQRHAEILYELDHFRYFAGESTLGTEWPPS